jgi:molybdopterin/thiamine biosynthesis adenylyltransferase/proteasome lid subunit RPN8/RPN11
VTDTNTNRDTGETATVTLTAAHHHELHQWLFRPDGHEHGAFLLCGVAISSLGLRLLVRQVLLVADDDFGPSDAGGAYQIAAHAVAHAARRAGDQGLALAWVHSHPGAGPYAGLSGQDRRTHDAALPAISAITGGQPVAALVLSETGAAGIVSTIKDPQDAPDVVEHLPVRYVRVIGSTLVDLAPAPDRAPLPAGRFDRQARLFGATGQARLRRLNVAVIGAGGGGSLIVQMLAHLGVGTITVVDFDTVEDTNLSRIVGATTDDATYRRPKTVVAERLVHSIDPDIRVVTFNADITYTDDALELTDVDFAFLATDTTYARWAFNLLCHQYLIPGVQIGAKVTSADDGTLETVHVMSRPIVFTDDCLLCAGVISTDALRDEQLSPEERRAQRYVDPPDTTDGDEDDDRVIEPSVISLNAIGASLAVTDFLFMVTGIHDPTTTLDHLVVHPRDRSLRHRPFVPNPHCPVCGTSMSARAMGDTWPLQLRPGHSAHHDTTDAENLTGDVAGVTGVISGLVERARRLVPRLFRRSDD